MATKFLSKPDAPEPTKSLQVMRSFRLVLALEVMCWCVVWFTLWELAAILSVNFGISAWYPPAAISLFLLIHYGPFSAPAIFAVSLLAGSAQWQGFPGFYEIVGSLGHTAAYLIAAGIYRTAPERHRFSIRPKSLSLLAIAAATGAVLASIVGNANVYFASGGEYVLTFERLLGWATGDFFGLISLCPMLLFSARHPFRPRTRLGDFLSMLRAPGAALLVAVALASAFSLIAGSSSLDHRLLSVVAVGIFSVIVAHVASPASAVIYLFLVAVTSALWLSTEVAAAARIEVAVHIATFLIAAFAMIGLSMEKMKARVAVINRRMRIRELSAQRDDLNRRISAVESEFAQLAHEFKTPLGGIIGLLEVAEGDVASGRDDDRVAQHFRYIRGCAWYLNAMVDDAFDVTRIARGQFRPAIKDFDISDVLLDLGMISHSKGGSDVAFTSAASIRRVIVRSDRNRLLQILINLVVNGIRYSDGAAPVRVDYAVSPDAVTISVCNSCATVTADQLDAHIGGRPGVADNPKGLGIGLPLVGKLAAGIGAQIKTVVKAGLVTISVSVPRV